MYHWPGYAFFIGWLLCLLTLFGSVGVVAVMAMQFSNMKTYQWVTAIVVNFFFTILFVEPVKVLIFTVFVAARKKPIWDQDHVDADEELPKIYYDMEDPENQKRPLRPKVIPPEYDPEYLEPLRFRRIQEGEMNAVIQDILIYLVYLVIVLYVAEGPKDISSFYMKENLQDTVVYGGVLCERNEGDERCKVRTEQKRFDNYSVFISPGGGPAHVAQLDERQGRAQQVGGLHQGAGREPVVALGQQHPHPQRAGAELVQRGPALRSQRLPG